MTKQETAEAAWREHLAQSGHDLETEHTYPHCFEAGRASLEPLVEQLVAALKEARRALYPNHSGHWDKTGGSGSGCPECQRQHAAQADIDAVLGVAA